MAHAAPAATPDAHAHGSSHVLPDPPHEFHHSWAPLVLAAGMTLLTLSVLYPKAVLPVALLVAAWGLGWWLKEDLARWRWVQSTGVKDPHPAPFWGMILFIGSEVFVFGSLFALWFVGKHHATVAGEEWWSHELPIRATAINTAILIASGGTLHWGMLRLKKDDRRGYLIGLFLTLLLGAAFLVGQVREYLEFIVHEGFTMKSGLFGGMFFGLTGTHGLHVFGGLAFLVWVFFRSLGKTQSKDHHMALETAAFYWHFVDVVWIFLFAVVYLRYL